MTPQTSTHTPDQTSPERTEHPPIAVIGGGNMASAILAGASNAGAIDLDRVVVADPDPAKHGAYPNGVASASEALAWLGSHADDKMANGDDQGRAGQVVFAVKPQIFPLVAEEVGEAFAAGPSRVVLSVLAGTTSETIRASLGKAARVVRVMPNTPAQVGRGVSAIALGAGAREGDDAIARRLMSAVGEVVAIDEAMMDAFTGLAGSGPAYVFYLAEALAKAGEAVGFTPEQAGKIAEGVVTGSARLLEADDRDAAELRSAVTSPNGTTQAGTESLDASGVMDAVVKAVTAARDRGREIAAS